MYAGSSYIVAVADICVAEYLRVLIADQSLVKLSPTADDKQFIFIGDISSDGLGKSGPCGVQSGDTVVVFGAGPVGLLAAYSAFLRGANKVYVVDRVQDRLFLTAALGSHSY